ncbi:MAG: hypothetical protein JNL01_06470 [Bdellovibrionales bacterium]|nr:hypothetical protein [Bdellovibrionales bacterium]
MVLDSRPHRYLGLNLSGAKNQKTSVAALEYYPNQKKVFLLDIHDRVPQAPDQTSDQALLELLDELKAPQPGKTLLTFDTALSLPPCVTCEKKCPMPEKCVVPSVKWMRVLSKKMRKSHFLRDEGVRVLEFTPYTQRPVELWLRYEVLPELPEPYRFEVDEALGGSRGPLVARLNFLQKHLKNFDHCEAHPKLSTSILAYEFGASKRLITAYRRLEEGAQARQELIEIFADRLGLFVYDRDLRKLSLSLASFDAFVCAVTGWLSDTGRTVQKPAGFPSEWIQYPDPDASAWDGGLMGESPR